MSARRALLTLSLVSGLGGVVYEVLYMRHLTTVLGDMFYVHAGLLCMFLFGNGVGAWLAHRFIRWLFAFELVIGLYAFALPTLIPIYETSIVSRVFADPVSQTLFASGLLLAVPSVSIGFSIPLFSAYIRGQGEARDAFKYAYLLYNLGAALSIVLVEFYLIRWIGLSQALYVVGTANLGCGAVLWVKRRAWHPPLLSATGQIRERLLAAPRLALLLSSIGASLFLAFYIKVCYHLFLPHRENFAICTAVSLLAIAIGTALVRRFRFGFGAAVGLAMVTLVGVYALFDPVVLAFELLRDATPVWTVTLRGFCFALLLAVPYVFLGATIPALMVREEDVARRAGVLLLLSGIGNVVGMLLYIFVVHPLLPVFATPLVAWLTLAAALAVHGGRALGVVRLALVGASLLLLPVVLQHPDARVYLVHDRVPTDAQVQHHKAASDNVSFVSSARRTYISYNGHPSIYVTSDGVVNRAEIVSGVLPALVAPKRERALVLGLGSGITAGATAMLFEHTDVVEINSAFFPLLDRIAAANFRIGSNERATIVHDDARSYLANTDRRYDVIVNSIPSPTYFAAGKIYTAEFFRMVRRGLVPGGVYGSWFAPTDMSADGLRTFLATLRTTFEHCNLAVLRNGYYFTSCGERPIRIVDPGSIDFPAELRAALAPLKGVTLEQYLEAIVLSGDIFSGQPLDDVQLNTDDFPIMEFQIMRRDRSSPRPERLPDPVVTDPARFNLELGLEDRRLLMERSLIFAQLHVPLFLRHYRPTVERDAELVATFNRRIGADESPAGVQ